MVCMLCSDCGSPYKPPRSNHTCAPPTYITNCDKKLSAEFECVDNFLEADVLVVCGGDGTVLSNINKIPFDLLHKITVLGVNTGHVGFLSNDISLVQVNNLFKLGRRRFNEYISKRMMLKVTKDLMEKRAVNEVVVQPTFRGKLFELIVEIDGEKLVYKGDGIIISTPSGSTAYNMSAGGPIINPELQTLTITPICPFSLSSRPIVLAHTSTIRITSIKSAEVVVDGMVMSNSKLDGMEVKVASEVVNLFKVDTFFSAIQKKLSWNKSIK